MNATVYFNGHALGTHPYGYTPFSFDLSEYAVCDGSTENVLAVKVDTTTASSRWYSGSGIIRDVSLSVQNPLYIPHNGVIVSAPDLSNEAGGSVTTHIRTTVNNASTDQEAQEIVVNQTIYDSDSNLVSSSSDSFYLEKNEKKEFEQNVNTSGIELWSVDNPVVYRLKTDIIEDGVIKDTKWTEFGYRYVGFDTETGFYLNGKRVKLKGVCLHSDYGALGTAVDKSALKRQLEMMKEMGANAVRVTHNPASPELLKLCDKMGLIVIEEAFDTWSMTKNGNNDDYGRFFSTAIHSDNKILNKEGCNNWVDFDMRQMLRQSVNYPCVMMYSLGNELFEGITNERGKNNYPTYASYLISYVKEFTDSHIITVGDNKTHKNRVDLQKQIDEKIVAAGGAIGLNYGNGSQYDALHEEFPSWPLYASEVASTVSTRDFYLSEGVDDEKHQITAYGTEAPSWGSNPWDVWKSVVSRDYMGGEFVWTGFDYTGEPTPWNASKPRGGDPFPKSSYFGIVDTAGFEKDIYYFYRSQWNDDSTTLHIAPYWDGDLIKKDRDGNVDVVVYSNAASVELFLNGKSLGAKGFDTITTEAGTKYRMDENGNMFLKWKVPYESGVLTARAYDSDGEIIGNTVGRRTTRTPGEAESLRLSAYEKKIDADGNSKAFITVEAIDKNGELVHSANDTITFSVSGDGTFAASDNGDPTDITKMKSSARDLFFGKALCIAESTESAGSFTVTARSQNLGSAEISIKTGNSPPETSDPGEDKEPGTDEDNPGGGSVNTGGSGNTTPPASDKPAVRISAPARPSLNTTVYTGSKRTVVKWKKVKDATGYNLAYRKAGAKKWTVKYTTKTAYVISKCTKSGLYEFKVSSVRKAGTKKYVSRYSEVSRRYIKSLSYSLKKGRKSFTVSWKKDSGASGYIIKYSVNRNMSGAKTVTVNGKNRSKHTVGKLKSGKTYYVRVAPYRKKGSYKYYGASVIKAVRTR